MNSLLHLLKEFDTCFNSCEYYDDYRKSFFKLYSLFKSYYYESDDKSKNLVHPLKLHFDHGLSIFFTFKKIKTSNESITLFISESNKIKNFWFDIIKDFKYVTNGPNIFYVFYRYLKLFHDYIDELFNLSKYDCILNNENAIIIVEKIHILYCVFYSSENILTQLNDNLYMYIEDDFKKFWQIFYNLKSTNCGETTYFLEILQKSSTKNYKLFCSKYKKIYNYYESDKNDKSYF